jgi:hypothetical protein
MRTAVLLSSPPAPRRRFPWPLVIGVVVVLLLLGGAAAGILVFRARFGPHRLTLTPATVPYKGEITVQGTGWSDVPGDATGKSVTIYVLGALAQQPVAGSVILTSKATVAPDGTFEQVVSLRDVQPGPHNIYVIGRDPTGPSAQASFTIAP